MNLPTEQIQELLAGSVLGDLSDAEREQLASIDTQQYSEFIWELHQTAASVDLACQTTAPAPLPEHLRLEIQAAAGDYVGSDASVRAIEQSDSVRPSNRLNTDAAIESRQKSGSGWSIREAVAWVACAAAILLCVNLAWKPQLQPLTAAQARAALLQSSDSAITVAWSAGPSEAPSTIDGDVVWDNARQEGYMRFAGLPVNDPTVEQYQLWIIDPGRDEEPVDGGVFDISSSGEVIVPINAKLPVVSPAAFAITIEKPGGVVVSTQERLPLLAAVK